MTSEFDKMNFVFNSIMSLREPSAEDKEAMAEDCALEAQMDQLKVEENEKNNYWK